MVLRLKTWESRSPPGLPSTPQKPHSSPPAPNPPPHAGWSSPVARQAHNLKVAGSNPAPATNPPPQARQDHPPGGRRRVLDIGQDNVSHPKGDRKSTRLNSS